MYRDYIGIAWARLHVITFCFSYIVYPCLHCFANSLCIFSVNGKPNKLENQYILQFYLNFHSPFMRSVMASSNVESLYLLYTENISVIWVFIETWDGLELYLSKDLLKIQTYVNNIVRTPTALFSSKTVRIYEYIGFLISLSFMIILLRLLGRIVPVCTVPIIVFLESQGQ